MSTLTKLSEKFNTGAFEHLVADVEIPVLTGMQRQGDVLIVPVRAGQVAGLKPVPSEGIAVVRGENGGNTHLLVAEGDVQFAPASGRGVNLGTLLVGKGSIAHLTHPEHGFNSIGTGTYIVKRQREQSDEIRIVQD